MKEAFPEKVFFENTNNERILCLNVTRTYLLSERENLYECTRKFWKLNVERARQADIVFGVCSGIIVGVFKPTLWYPSEEYLGRWEFEGEELNDSPYLMMDISHILCRRQNPVMYINM